MKKLIQMLRDAGATTRYLPTDRISLFLRYRYAYQRGINFSRRQKSESIRYGFDGYLSIDVMPSMHSLPKEDFCVACFSGRYLPTSRIATQAGAGEARISTVGPMIRSRRRCRQKTKGQSAFVTVNGISAHNQTLVYNRQPQLAVGWVTTSRSP
jgi:hypothetical protein